jgi:hypothetical protein
MGEGKAGKEATWSWKGNERDQQDGESRGSWAYLPRHLRSARSPTRTSRLGPLPPLAREGGLNKRALQGIFGLDLSGQFFNRPEQLESLFEELARA